MGRKSFRNWLKPELPPHLREEFILLAAQHLRGQSQLLFSGFILSLPMVILAACRGRTGLGRHWPSDTDPHLLVGGSVGRAQPARRYHQGPQADAVGMVCMFRRGGDG